MEREENEAKNYLVGLLNLSRDIWPTKGFGFNLKRKLMAFTSGTNTTLELPCYIPIKHYPKTVRLCFISKSCYRACSNFWLVLQQEIQGSNCTPSICRVTKESLHKINGKIGVNHRL